MWALIIRRIFSTIPVMLVVAVIVFFLARIGPGDPAVIFAGDSATSGDIERIRILMGLDRPLVVQFVQWLWRILQGDLGVSVFNNRPVLTLIFQRLEPTISLAILTIILSIVVAVPFGILAAWKAGTWIDRAVMVFAVAGFSLPLFLIGYVLVYCFALEWRLFPVQSYRALSDGFVPFIRHLILPSVTLSMVYIALLARMTRSTMIEVLNEDYIRTARAKGLGMGAVLLRHALQNASVPIVTTVGVGIALLIGGVVVTESVFAIPGLGRLTIDSVLKRDYPVIQGVTLMVSFVYVLINLLIDLSYTLLDPRIRY